MAYLQHWRARSPLKKVARLRPEDREKAAFHPHSMYRVAEFSGEMAPADPDYVPRGGIDHRSKIRYSSRALRNEVLRRKQPVGSIYENEEDEDSRGSRNRVAINDQDKYTPCHAGPYELGSESDFPSSTMYIGIRADFVDFGTAESRSEAVGRRFERDGRDRHGVAQCLVDTESTDGDMARSRRSFTDLEMDGFDRRARVGSVESSRARERPFPSVGSKGNNDWGDEERVKRTLLFPRGRGSFHNCNNYLDSDRPAWDGSSYNCRPRMSSDFSGPREPPYDSFPSGYSGRGRGTGYRDPSYSSVPYAYSERARGSKVDTSSRNRPELPIFGLSNARAHEQRTSAELFYVDRYPTKSKRSSRHSQVNDKYVHHRSADTKNEVRVEHESNGRYTPSSSQKRLHFEHVETDEYVRVNWKRSRNF